MSLSNSKKLSVFYFIFLLLIFSSCKQFSEKQERINCICLIDYSGSLSAETLNFYSKIISKDVFFNLHHRDKLTVMPIDEAAKTQATKIYLIDFAANKSFAKKTDPITHQQDSIKMRMDSYRNSHADSLYNIILSQKEIRKKYTMETDIVSALQQAADLQEKNGEEEKYHVNNVIVILSDMLHESSEFNLRKTDPTDTVAFNRYISDLKSAGRIPNLKDCRIYVNGRTGNNNAQVDIIQKFWSKFFKESGATLCKYDYDCGNDIIASLKAIK